MTTKDQKQRQDGITQQIQQRQHSHNPQQSYTLASANHSQTRALHFLSLLNETTAYNKGALPFSFSKGLSLSDNNTPHGASHNTDSSFLSFEMTNASSTTGKQILN